MMLFLHLEQLQAGTNIVQFLFTQQVGAFCHVFTEWMPDGNLIDYGLAHPNISEKLARDAIRGALTGLKFMHDRNMYHRNIYMESLLVTATGSNSLHVRLASFGSSIVSHRECKRGTLCGVPGFLAPEMLEFQNVRTYDMKCDIYSMGSVAYVLIAGYQATGDHDDETVLENTYKGNYLKFNPTIFDSCSKHVKPFLAGLLMANPKRRMTAIMALNHQFIKEKDADLGANTFNIDLRTATLEKCKREPCSKERLEQLYENFIGVLINQGQKSISGTDEQERQQTSGDGLVNKDAIEKCIKTERKKLGVGGFGAVFECEIDQTKKLYAVKVHFGYDNEQTVALNDVAALRRECASLRQCSGCQHIIRLIDCRFDCLHPYLVMELAASDLGKSICDKAEYSESDAREAMKGMFLALEYMHAEKIAHRDIKPITASMWRLKKDDLTSIKVASLGSAKVVPEPSCLVTLCGTSGFIAPEVYEGAYNELADCFSAGAVIYWMLSGDMAFGGATHHDIEKKVIMGNFRMPNGCSKEVRRLLGKLLDRLANRSTAKQALECNWFKMEMEALAVNNLSVAQQSMKANPRGEVDFERIRRKTAAPVVANVKRFNELYSMDEATKVVEGGAFVLCECKMTRKDAITKEPKEIFVVKRFKRNALKGTDATGMHTEMQCLKKLSDIDVSGIVRQVMFFWKPIMYTRS
ncbi:hypothetical protein MPSEU_000150000 [Mayamaea pseudoterrestris]|nr:hypothetical protein MPSEU_000150000 [Mayamaea pseudoterrestris]